ncbi:polyketide biosynthesis acyl carrier protein [Micromonospora luteifusca]|uniref:Polyketide biosynthesis acyl carrier protein n=1 Tax=Micromonospora luteifusca TaxID=709860 RepID=A0ABS2M164_9ACTN|nr:phosphopantetheine-binding protein [Micromonospora luteifusca]MBM7494178.1 polyketide biosynthesis acyl carrier protein [Micromonospora luteifusca]
MSQPATSSTPAASDPLLEVIGEAVHAVVPEVDPADVTADRTLAELGCNSVDRAEVMVAVMGDLGITVHPSEFSRDLSIRSLIALLRKYE